MNEYEDTYLLIVKDKYYTYNFIIKTKLDLHNKCIQLLKSRMDAHFYDDYLDMAKTDFKAKKEKLTQIIADLDDPSIQYVLSDRLKQLEIDELDMKRHNQWLKRVSNIIKIEVDEESDIVKQELAYGLLSYRSKYEYEHVELVCVDEIEYYLNDFNTKYKRE